MVENRILDGIGQSGIMIFDGSCGACSVFIGERKVFFERYGFTVAPLQESWIRDLTGLKEEILLEAIHLYTTEGDILRGVDLFRYLFSKIWWLAPVALLLRIAFLRSPFQWIYDFVAKRRRRISRICGLQSRAFYK